ncbi:MAG: cytochrome c oxidase assembly protein, partial [Chloroflexota bacterium]
PRTALVIYLLTLYGWHIPVAYEAAVTNLAIHYLQHATMFIAALLFWWPLVGPAPVRSQLRYPERLIYVLVVVTPSAALGAGITLVGHVLYGHYELTPEHFAMTALEDQTLGGLLMWVPGNVVLILAITVIFFRWYEYEERKSRLERRSRARARRERAGVAESAATIGQPSGSSEGTQQL